MTENTITHSRPIVTLAEARANGLMRYFTGKPCKHGHVAERTTSTKICRTCQVEYQSRPECRAQAAVRDRKRAEAPENKARKAAHDAKRRSTEEYRKIEIVRDRARSSDPKRIAGRAASHERKMADPEYRARKAARTREWGRENPEAQRANQNNRRSREMNAEGSHTKEDIRRIHTAQGGKCACCRDSLKNGKHLDHITPLILGGTNWPRNLQLLCPPCNLRKSAKDPIVFYQERGFLL